MYVLGGLYIVNRYCRLLFFYNLFHFSKSFREYIFRVNNYIYLIISTLTSLHFIINIFYLLIDICMCMRMCVLYVSMYMRGGCRINIDDILVRGGRAGFTLKKLLKVDMHKSLSENIRPELFRIYI